MKLNYAIVFVSNMDRSVAFYRDSIGLTLTFSTSHWSEFNTGEATLALHLASAAPSGSDTNHEAAGTCRPGLSVEDLDTFHARMMDRGVKCLQKPKESFGARIAKYEDPDGLVISVSESRVDG